MFVVKYLIDSSIISWVAFPVAIIPDKELTSCAVKILPIALFFDVATKTLVIPIPLPVITLLRLSLVNNLFSLGSPIPFSIISLTKLWTRERDCISASICIASLPNLKFIFCVAWSKTFFDIVANNLKSLSVFKSFPKISNCFPYSLRPSVFLNLSTTYAKAGLLEKA